MKILLTIIAAFTATPAFSGMRPGAELFTPPGLDGTMMVETSKYRFTLRETDDAYLVEAASTEGEFIRHELAEGRPFNTERIFALESNGCAGKSIDLIMQIAPEDNSDSERRRYYRVIFSPSLNNIISKFYDPSVSAVNAILPLQSVEGITDPDTGLKITCVDSIPVVTSGQ